VILGKLGDLSRKIVWGVNILSRYRTQNRGGGGRKNFEAKILQNLTQKMQKVAKMSKNEQKWNYSRIRIN
jgi:hypothetical protein